MALITSAASGNFSAGATWTGGVVPTTGDEARAATGHTITINVNTTCDEISNAGTGIFTLNDGITLTANVTNKSATTTRNCLQFTAASPAVGYIVGNVTAGTTTSAVAVINSSSGKLTITGNALGGSGNSAFSINNTSSGEIDITGNVNGGSSILTYGINNAAGGIINITGNITGGTGVSNSPHAVNNAAAGSITAIGSVTGGTSTGIQGVGINNASTGTLTVTGGDITATNTSNAIVSRTGTNRISGSFISASNGNLPVDATKIILLTTPATAKTRYALNGTGTYVDMFTADNGLTQAAPADVRSGTVYADGILTGTLAVPAAGSVALGVPVDATTGTAVLTPAAVWEYATRSLTTSSGATAAEIRAEMDSNSTKLANLDTTVSSRLATSGYTAPSAAPTVTAIRQEMDANSIKLANLDATVSSRLANSAYSAAPTTAQIATAVEGSLLNEADGQTVLNAIVGAIGNTNLSEVSLVAAVRADLERVGGKIDSIPTTSAPTAAANATAVWSAATKTITGGTVDTLTNSPSVPSAASIASATRTELTTELGRLDAAVSTRLATSGYTAPSTAPTAAANASAVRSELTVELAKVAALNTDRLANVATTAIVGNLIAQANS